VRLALHWQDGQGNQIRVVLQGLQEPAVSPLFVKSADAARKLEGSRKARHHVPVTLPVKLYLSGLVLHKLSLVAAFYRTQLFPAAVREQPARQGQREKPHHQQDSKDYVKEAYAPETVKHEKL
jgi:hypothetical protein